MKRIIIALFAVLLAAVWVLTSCNQIKSGEVYDKNFVPAHDETYVEYEYIHTGNDTIRMPVMHKRYCPDRYFIYIRKETDNGEYDKACHEVGKDRYDSIEIGDEVSFD